VSERLPAVSGDQLIGALGKLGWVSVRQRGSHVRLKHPDRPIALVVPLHRELKRGTLAGILRDAGVERDELRRLLRVRIGLAPGGPPHECSADPP
jgi:predicted RNA binding protein YcfA (HicA-like mRNA interferase family)